MLFCGVVVELDICFFVEIVYVFMMLCFLFKVFINKIIFMINLVKIVEWLYCVLLFYIM